MPFTASNIKKNGPKLTGIILGIIGLVLMYFNLR